MHSPIPRTWRARTAFTLVLVLAAATAGFAPCGSSKPIKRPKVTHPLQDGQSIGKIERSAGGTAVVTNVRSLLALTCLNDQLTLRTNIEVLFGTLDCARMISQPIADRFLGQPIVVTYTGGNLQLENPSAGTIVLPNVKDVVVANLDGSP